MADKLQRELSNRHIQLIAIGGYWNRFISWCWPIYSFNRPIYLTNIHNSRFVLFMFMRAMGELLLSIWDLNRLVTLLIIILVLWQVLWWGGHIG